MQDYSTKRGGTRVIGVAMMCVDPVDNTIDLVASEGPTSTLMAHRLLHLKDSLVLIPPQLSCPHVDRDEESHHPV